MNNVCVKCNRPGLKRDFATCWYCRVAEAKEARNGMEVLDFEGEAEPPAFPTRGGPGSEEKIMAMETRAFLGQELWHSLDGLVK